MAQNFAAHAKVINCSGGIALHCREKLVVGESTVQFWAEPAATASAAGLII
jgi:hypothetical protein